MDSSAPVLSQASDARVGFFVALVAMGLALGSAPAAEATTRQAAAPPTVSPDQEWLEAEPLGLRFQPPTPAFAKAETVDGVFRYEVVDSEREPRWWLRFQILVSSRSGLSARDQITAYLDTLTRNGKPFTIRLDEKIRPAGAIDEGILLIIEAPVGDGSTGLTGWMLLPTAPDRFLAASIAMPLSAFDAMLPQLRAAFAGMQVTALQEIEAARKARMAEGERVLSFGPDALRAAIQEEPLIYRIYRPASSGSQEIELGWLTVRTVAGQRGEVDPARDAKSYRGADLEPGLLVILDAKSLVSPDGRNVVDTQTRAWMAWDRSSELWSTRSTQRQGPASRTTAQTGIRTAARPGQPRPRLEVINSVAERQSRDQADWVVPPNYLSQAELLVLGKLLPRSETGQREFASYAFDPRSNGLPQRSDLWRRNDDGTFTLETRIGGSSQPLIQTFDASGERIRRIDEDAAGVIVTERIDLDALRTLWRRKGLPLE